VSLLPNVNSASYSLNQSSVSEFIYLFLTFWTEFWGGNQHQDKRPGPERFSKTHVVLCWWFQPLCENSW